MLQHLTPLAEAHRGQLPTKTRPLVRWRREPFGLLAAFPDGHVGVLDPDAQQLLQSGADYARCSPYLVPRMEIATDFHFSAPLMVWLELTSRLQPSLSSLLRRGWRGAGRRVDHAAHLRPAR